MYSVSSRQCTFRRREREENWENWITAIIHYLLSYCLCLSKTTVASLFSFVVADVLWAPWCLLASSEPPPQTISDLWDNEPLLFPPGFCAKMNLFSHHYVVSCPLFRIAKNKKTHLGSDNSGFFISYSSTWKLNGLLCSKRFHESVFCITFNFQIK